MLLHNIVIKLFKPISKGNIKYIYKCYCIILLLSCLNHALFYINIVWRYYVMIISSPCVVLLQIKSELLYKTWHVYIHDELFYI